MAGVLAGAAIAAAAPGVIKAVGSMFGGGKRRKEQREAARELKTRQQDYESFQFKDPTADMTNPFEDLTVNQQQDQFQAQQSQQGLANTMSGLQGAAGGSGIAALAQAMAGQQSQNLQAASASIGAQEAANQMKAAQGAQTLQAKRAEGAKYVQNKEFDRTSTLLGMAQERKSAADAAREAAKQDLVGGLADAAGSAGAVLTGGVGGGAGAGAAGGVGDVMKSAGLGTTKMKDYGASFLKKTQGMDLTIPKLN